MNEVNIRNELESFWSENEQIIHELVHDYEIYKAKSLNLKKVGTPTTKVLIGDIEKTLIEV